MQDPIDALLEEHRAIMGKLDPLRAAVRSLEERGDAAAADALPALKAASETMATQLKLHARKEDEALFPALEKLLGTGAGPTSVMRREHQQIHAQADLFRRTLHELHDIEHPAIERHGAELREIAVKGRSAAELRGIGSEILRLLDAHFGKEETILFPMARSLLQPESLRRVMERMEEIEAEARR